MIEQVEKIIKEEITTEVQLTKAVNFEDYKKEETDLYELKKKIAKTNKIILFKITFIELNSIQLNIQIVKKPKGPDIR